jgi:hypothetical protein
LSPGLFTTIAYFSASGIRDFSEVRRSSSDKFMAARQFPDILGFFDNGTDLQMLAF